MALSVLVLMEMLKALSAVSLDASLLTFPPWNNPLLLAATLGPVGMHLLFMYTPALAALLRLQPLALREWKVNKLLIYERVRRDII
jgi:Ca2+-transporting ATPase